VEMRRRHRPGILRPGAVSSKLKKDELNCVSTVFQRAARVEASEQVPMGASSVPARCASQALQ
jgi:hypothetical protein